jgi:hypothetical protein
VIQRIVSDTASAAQDDTARRTVSDSKIDLTDYGPGGLPVNKLLTTNGNDKGKEK